MVGSSGTVDLSLDLADENVRIGIKRDNDDGVGSLAIVSDRLPLISSLLPGRIADKVGEVDTKRVPPQRVFSGSLERFSGMTAGANREVSNETALLLFPGVEKAIQKP